MRGDSHSDVFGGRVRGVVRWFNLDLQVLIIECENGFAIGSVERGECQLNDVLLGEFCRERFESVVNERTGATVEILVEAIEVSEDQANELLGLLRD